MLAIDYALACFLQICLFNLPSKFEEGIRNIRSGLYQNSELSAVGNNVDSNYVPSKVGMLR
jgi:hypothetical protein